MDHARDLERLHLAMRAAHDDDSPAARALVKDAACALVAACKADGWAVEAVIIEVKRLAADLGKPMSADRVTRAAVTWCIEHYYAGS